MLARVPAPQLAWEKAKAFGEQKTSEWQSLIRAKTSGSPLILNMNRKPVKMAACTGGIGLGAAYDGGTDGAVAFYTANYIDCPNYGYNTVYLAKGAIRKGPLGQAYV